MMKRFMSAALVTVIAWTSGLLGLAEAYAATLPVVIEKTGNYTVLQNSDGTRTLRIECTADELTDPAQMEAWIEQGDSWRNEGAVVAQIDAPNMRDTNGAYSEIIYVKETHKSSDFIEFLNILDSKYPQGEKIRIILDNHSAHTSKETLGFLQPKPGRFKFVLLLSMVRG
jgi:hypothetical protein